MGSEVADQGVRDRRATEYARPAWLGALVAYRLTSLIDGIIESTVHKSYSTTEDGCVYTYKRVFGEQSDSSAHRESLSTRLAIHAEHTRDGKVSSYDVRFTYNVGNIATHGVNYFVVRGSSGTRVEVDNGQLELVGAAAQIQPSEHTEVATPYEITDLQERLAYISERQRSESTEG